MVNHYPYMRSGSRVWVQGEAGAKSYLVAPNSSVDLWDSESHTIFVKSADISGLPSMQVLEYTIKEPRKAQEPVKDDKPIYVSIEEFKALKSELEALKKQIHRPNQKKGGSL